MREACDEQLTSLTRNLVDLAATVRISVRQATQALIDGNAQVAETVIAGDRDVDRDRDLIEQHALELLATQAPVATDLRQIVAVLRTVADLERIGDLSVHIAKISRLRTPAVAVPAPVRPDIAEMAETADAMIGLAARLIVEQHPAAVVELEQHEETLNGLRRSILRAVLNGDWQHGVEPAIDLALLGRYYERIGDHAVSVVHRVIFTVTGELPEHHEGLRAEPTT